MKSPISALLIGSDLRAQDRIEDALKTFGDDIHLFPSVMDLQQGMPLIQSGSPHIIILNVEEVEQGVKETAFIVSRFPRTTIFVTAADKNPDWILRLIRAGANEYLTKPVATSELVDAVNKVSRFHAQTGASNSKRGAAISVYNPCGGMGTTTIAVNLAASLALQGKKTALIDLNLCSGDVATFLDLTPRYTLSSLAAKMGQLDANFLRSVVIAHASGVQVLNSPYDLCEAGKVLPELLQEVITLFRNMYEYTIIDAGGTLYGCNMAAFDSSDLILFNTVLNLPALRNAKRYLAAMESTGLGEDPVKLVVNRHNPKSDIKIADMEKILNMKTYHTVPNAYAEVKESINNGVPLVGGNQKSQVVKALEDLVAKLLMETTAVGKYAL